MATIDSFTGEHDFLVNFYPHPVEYEGAVYPSNEHAFQAAKTADPTVRERIRLAVSPHAAKQLGRQAALRSDWQQAKYEIMKRIVKAKFAREPLRSRLLATGNAKLIEGNDWGDRTWGCTRDPNGKWGGKNWLGKILMEVRDEIRAERETP